MTGRVREVVVAASPSDLRPSPFVRCLLFDLDGTLVDSEEANLAAYNVVLGRLGIDIPPGWYAERFGLPAPTLLEIVSREWGVDFDVDEFVAYKNDAYIRLADTIEVFPEMSHLLATGGAARRTGVVTSSPAVTARAVLEATGLDPMMEVLVARDDVTATKPAAEPYLLAADLLEVSPALCLAYEDSDPGIEAAVTAGIQVVDVRPVLGSS